MHHALVFVVAPESALPSDGASLVALESAQRLGLGNGMALRILRTPNDWEGELEDLVSHGLAEASGLDPFRPKQEPAQPPPSGERRRLLCDAVVPHLEPRSQWLGVYVLNGELSGEPITANPSHPCRRLELASIQCLDRFPLRDAENETCWFYPTEDGTYLGWENQRRIETLPGFLPERPYEPDAPSYERKAVHVLWSLMADDLALTCVGITFRGRRIEWPIVATDPEPFATWTSFRVDTSAENSYQENSSITVFRPD